MRNLVLAVMLLGTYALSQTCAQQNFNSLGTPQYWIDATDHTSGDHSVGYSYYNTCQYSGTGPCAVVQSMSVTNMAFNDTGNVNTAPHSKMTPAYKNSQVSAPSGQTSTTVEAAGVVQECIPGGCGNITITVPPLVVTGPQQVASFSAQMQTYCPAKTSQSGGGSSGGNCNEFNDEG